MEIFCPPLACINGKNARRRNTKRRMRTRKRMRQERGQAEQGG
jgi:hypothetical protein